MYWGGEKSKKRACYRVADFCVLHSYFMLKQPILQSAVTISIYIWPVYARGGSLFCCQGRPLSLGRTLRLLTSGLWVTMTTLHSTWTPGQYKLPWVQGLACHCIP
uniref:Uncharacterized protein n=1 Tax=Anguilla anguilla TaxID=7936 RepID=A0A0E9WUZ9_ANGAN